MESKQAWILCVDDEAINVRLLEAILEPQGYKVAGAASGPEALELLQALPIDLVFLDVMMPSMNGFEVCRRIKEDERLRDIPVVMITVLSDREDRILGIEAGADDYLVKPFSPRELLARIKSILRRTRALPPNLRPESQRCLVFAGWRLDTATRLLTAPDGVAVPLSGGEYRLLRLLLDHPNRALNRDQLMELLEKYPPSLGRVLKLDPSLLANSDYLATYPSLATFLAQHPDVQRNPGYYFERIRTGNEYVDTRSESYRIWNDMLG